MKILVISQYFPPEPGATSNRLLSFVEAMVKRGHDVTVICEFPNHPVGILSPEDKWRLYRVEDNGSYKVVRTFVMTFAKKNNIKRMLFYLSFAFSSFIAILFLRRHDVVFASSPPIFHAFTSMIAAKIKRSTFILDVRDLWPDGVLEVEAVSNKVLLKYGNYIETIIYKNAKTIFTVSKGLKEKIENRGGKNKVRISYNGSFEKMLKCNGDIEEFRKLKGWMKKTVIAYAGLIGLTQDLTRLLPEICELSREDLLFLFIGGGPEKEKLSQKIEQSQLENVKLVDLMPVNKVIQYLHSVDVMLVVLRETELFKAAIPSKFFDCMAAGKPVISNVDGELREIMEKHNTGIYFSLKEPGSFKSAINNLINDPDKRKLLGDNGRKLVQERFLRSKLADQAVKAIENTMMDNLK